MLKRFISVLLAILLIMGVFWITPVRVWAATYTYGDYKYEILDDGTVSLTRYIGSEGDVSIPGLIGWKSVTRIGDGAFAHCGSLTSITIPNSVSSIGSAFYGCNNLNIIDVSSSNKQYCSIDGVLYSKDKKTIIAWPEAKGHIQIPDSVTSIGSNAFSFISSLTSITIPDSVTSIGDHAFSNCSYLASVTIPDSVTSIGNYAFSNCKSLTIYAKEKSYAQTYALNNNIPFEAVKSASDTQTVISTDNNDTQNSVSSDTNKQISTDTTTDTQRTVTSDTDKQKSTDTTTDTQKTVTSDTDKQKSTDTTTDTQKTVSSDTDKQKSTDTTTDTQKPLTSDTDKQKSTDISTDTKKTASSDTDASTDKQPTASSDTETDTQKPAETSTDTSTDEQKTISSDTDSEIPAEPSTDTSSDKQPDLTDSEKSSDTPAQQTDPCAIDHKYKLDGFTWSDDNSSAKAKFVCENNSEHTKDVDAVIETNVTNNPTCEENRTEELTATAELNGEKYTDKKTRMLIKTGHEYEAVWNWPQNADKTIKTDQVTVTLTCKNDPSHTATVKADVTEKIRSEDEDESIIDYYATAVYDGEKYPDSVGVTSVKPVILGDLDGDSSLTANDALIILRASSGLITITSQRQTKAADYDQDGAITSADAIIVLRESTM